MALCSRKASNFVQLWDVGRYDGLMQHNPDQLNSETVAVLSDIEPDRRASGPQGSMMRLPVITKCQLVHAQTSGGS